MIGSIAGIMEKKSLKKSLEIGHSLTCSGRLTQLCPPIRTHSRQERDKDRRTLSHFSSWRAGAVSPPHRGQSYVMRSGTAPGDPPAHILCISTCTTNTHTHAHLDD